MYLFAGRALIMSLYMVAAGLLCQGCTYQNYWSFLEASFLFGIMSSSVYFISHITCLKMYFQKVVFFSFLMNAFILLLLWKVIPGFHLASTSTAVWMSLVMTLIDPVKRLYSFYSLVRSAKGKTTKMKLATAKVICSKKNRLQ